MGNDERGWLQSGLILLLVLLGAWVFRTPAVQGVRPPDGGQGRHLSPRPQDVPARLWQDPFRAVERFRGGETPAGASAGARGTGPLRAQLDAALRPLAGRDGPRQERPPSRVKLVLAPLRGAPYSDEAEKRRRHRYAVLAGFAAEGFTPLDAEHVGYWMPPCHQGAAVPYEVLVRGAVEQGREAALLVWVNEDLIEDRPWHCLGELFDALREGLADRPTTEPAPVLESFLIGPFRSGTLANMVREAGDDRPDRLRGLTVLSPSATLPDSAFRLPTGVRGVEELFQSPPQHLAAFRRTISDDADLAAVLVDELRRRGVDPVCAEPLPWAYLQRCRAPPVGDDPYRGHRHHLALLGEWDTDYGRGLPALMEGAIAGRLPPGDRVGKAAPGAAGLPWVHRFRYLRGLDGQLPGGADREGAEARGDDAAARGPPLPLQPPGGFAEPAFGHRQLDYARRLAARIADLDADLRRRGMGRVKAVGVLGSDVYDKLILLQALRQYLPDRVYFTTDLDALYLDLDLYPSTRNLVVAAGFGLRLAPELQQGIAPFRSSYQTSAFLAARLAACGRGKDATAASACAPLEVALRGLRPQLFEVGRQRFFPLSATPGRAPVPASVDPYPPAWRFPLPAEWRSYGPWVALLALLFAYSTFGPLYDRVNRMAAWSWRHLDPRRFLTPAGRPLRYLLSGIGLWLLVPAWLTLRLCGPNPGAEPFALAAGVSIWPSELLRLSAGLLGWVFMLAGWASVQRHNRRLAVRFGLDDRPPPADGNPLSALAVGARSTSFTQVNGLLHWCVLANDRSSADAWVRQGGRGRGAAKDREVAKGSGDAAARGQVLWSQGRYLGGVGPRLWRILPRAVLLYALGMLVAWGLNEPFIPARGDAAFCIDQVVSLWFFGLPFVLLLFWVLDETRLCSCQIRWLARDDVDWAPVTRERLCGHLPHLDREVQDLWIAMQFIARRTEVVSNLVFFPFVLLALLLISLSAAFDRWDTPAGVLGILLLCAALAIGPALMLRRSARHAKARILERLDRERLRWRSEEGEHRSLLLRDLRDRVDSLRRGAFRDWYNEPVVKALLSVVAVGAMVLNQYYRLGG